MNRYQWFRSAIHPLYLVTTAWLLILGICIGLTAAQAAQPTCIEPIPSNDLDHGGIEGRSHWAQGGSGSAGKMPGGSGGTGKMPGGSGGTGIMGTITAFGSVCVNGLEIDFDSSTTLRHNGIPVHLRALALGQIVAIDASGPELRLTARHIFILDALQGPVTRLDPRHGMLYVMDQPIIINDTTRPNGLVTLGALQLNNLVRVSGFRDVNGIVHATRLEPVSHLKEHSAVGTLQRTASGAWNLSGLPLHATNRRLSASVGENALVRGRWNGRQLVMREVEIDPLPSLLEEGVQMIAEGLVLEHQDPLKLRISNFDIDLTPQTQISDTDPSRLLAKGRLVLVSGHLAGKNRIVADTIKGSVSAGSHGSTPLSQRFSPTAVRPAHRNVSDLDQPSTIGGLPTPPDSQDRAAPSDRNEPIGQTTAPDLSAATHRDDSTANPPASVNGKKNPSAGSQGPGGFGGGRHSGGKGQSGGASRGR
ncbi:MAG: hypothetical protein H6973_17665 [Gammaproteobacteria bacterium]|nr:hypothetical protein [Gammaproteobacteria bacterium]